MAQASSIRLTASTVAFGALVCTSHTSAQIFDNGDPSGGFGTNVLSERDSFNQVADDFDLAGSATVGQIQWWGSGDGDTFEMRIFSVELGNPSNTPLHTVGLGTVAGTPTGFGGGDILEYNAGFADINLGPGDYLLSIVETTPGNDWFWSASCEDGCEGESWRRGTDVDAWATGNWQFAFVLDVPEPGTGALAVLGGLAMLRRRR